MRKIELSHKSGNSTINEFFKRADAHNLMWPVPDSATNESISQCFIHKEQMICLCSRHSQIMNLFIKIWLKEPIIIPFYGKNTAPKQEMLPSIY